MKRHSPALSAALALALLVAACQPQAPTPPAEAAPTPFATLDGVPLDRALLDEIARQQAGSPNPYDAAAASPPPIADTLPPEQRQRLLDELVDVELLARKARERGLDREPSVVAEAQLQARTIVAQAMVRDVIATLRVTDEELAAAYDERVPPHEFRVAHILLADEASAREAMAEVRRGRPFAEVARKRSIDPHTRSTGGELGSLLYDQMPPSMAQAVRHLTPGAHAPEPVRTERGWHVVRLLGLAPLAERPTMAVARVWLHPQILHAKVEALQRQWREGARVQVAATP